MLSTGPTPSSLMNILELLTNSQKLGMLRNLPCSWNPGDGKERNKTHLGILAGASLVTLLAEVFPNEGQTYFSQRI